MSVDSTKSTFFHSAVKGLPHVGLFFWGTLSPLDPKLRPSFQGAAGVML